MKCDTECYWVNLRRIKEAFPGKEELNQRETAKYLGIFYTKIKNHVKFKNNKISIVDLAKRLS